MKDRKHDSESGEKSLRKNSDKIQMNCVQCYNKDWILHELKL
ncbi:MAG: hypothetical protein ACR5KW_03050 [Wolbachia sp.]